MQRFVGIYYTLVFAAILTFHYLIALNIEIIRKISRASAQKYKKRVFFYHIFSIGMTIAFVFLVFTLEDFKIIIDINIRSQLTYNLLVWYIGGLSLIAWICVGIYFKIMIKLRSTSLFNLLLLTILSNISITVSTIVPQILYYFEESYQGPSNIILIVGCIHYSLGISEFIVLILNKNSIKLIKNTITKCKSKLRRKDSIMRSSRQNSRDLSLKILTDINESMHSFSDGGLLYYLFDQITKEVALI